jgi:hypothetical protein
MQHVVLVDGAETEAMADDRLVMSMPRRNRGVGLP